MKYVIGVDLGTSAVKLLLVDQTGAVVEEVSKSLTLIQEKTGYSEQDPQEWVDQTIAGLSDLLKSFKGEVSSIEGISFSGQMHGLVLLDENNKVLRNAILWNDTRTTAQCREIYDVIGKETLLKITKNPALEGFTLPKIIWVRDSEPNTFQKVKTLLLPKDYLRYKLTGKLNMEYSDASGTLLLDLNKREWSSEICQAFGIEPGVLPPLIASHEEVGSISSEIAEASGLSRATRVFAGAADNACGAIGSGILQEGKTLCSIGTSGAVLSYEEDNNKDFEGDVHYFHHGLPNKFYTMGVTLSAGYSLAWFKNVFAENESFTDLLADIDTVPIGSNGLLFSPYLVGERTPYANSDIRASFIGMDASHRKKDFVRAVLEGITFSLNESIHIFRKKGKKIESIVSIGGGAKNETWLQLQADIFNANIIKLSSEQGPALGAAILAAYGCGWRDNLNDCADLFLREEKVFFPKKENVKKYRELFTIYQDVFSQTKNLSEWLLPFRE